MRFALALLLFGCGGPVEPESGWQPLHGAAYVTKNFGFTFYWVGPYGKYQTPEETGVEIDRLFWVEWCPAYEARWGFGLSRQQRQAALQRVSIQLFADWRIPGRGDPGYTMGIWWPWDHQIDSAMGAAMHWDAGMNRWSEGLQNLIHEWSHVFQGEYHP